MGQLSSLPEGSVSSISPASLDAGSPTRGADRRARILAYLRTRSESGAATTIVELRRALRMSNVFLARELAALRDDGCIVHTGRRRGWVVIGVYRAGVTLLSLLDRAARCVIADQVARSGPRTRGKLASDRRIEHLSPSQYAKVRTAAGIAAEACTPAHDAKQLGAVVHSDLGWDAGAGTWALVERVRSWSRTQRLASPAATAAHVEGITLLLDLAATHGWIGRQPTHTGELSVHAAEWEQWIHAVLPTLGAHELSPSARARLMVGLRGLSCLATRLAMEPTAAIDWTTVAETLVIERSVATPALPREVLRLATSALNRLIDTGMAGCEYVGGRRSGRNRDGLVSEAAIRQAVEHGDWSGWHDASGRPYSALLDGPFSLRRFVNWLDARIPASALAEQSLPPRLPGHGADLATKRRAARKRKAGKPWYERRVSSLTQRLKQLNVLAGFAARKFGIDWTSNASDARRIIDSTLIRAYSKEWATRCGKSDTNFSSVQVARVVEAAAQLASPFCSGVSAMLGDTAGEREMMETSSALAVLVEEHLPPRNQVAARENKIAFWSEGDPELADQRLAALEARLRSRVIVEGGGLGPAQQVAAIEAGTLKLRNRFHWRCAVRDYAAFVVWRRIPMRGHNLGALLMGEEWRAHGDQPWEGAILVNVSDEDHLKTSEPLMVWLIKHAGDPGAEATLPRDVLQLFLMTGGARDQLLFDGTERCSSPFVFVSDARTCGRAEARARRIEEGLPWLSCSAAFERWIIREGGLIGLKEGPAPRGARRAHILRHLGATLWESRGLPDYARVLLGHARGGDTAGTHYISRTAHALAPEEALAQARSLPRRYGSASSAEASAATSDIATSVVSAPAGPECAFCFESLRVRDGCVATKCGACGEWQPGAVARGAGAS